MSSHGGYGGDGRDGVWRQSDQMQELSTGPVSWWQLQTSGGCGGFVSGGRGRGNVGGGNTHVVLVPGVNIGAVDVASSSATSVRKKSKVSESNPFSAHGGYGGDGRDGGWRQPDQRRELSTGPVSWWQLQTSGGCGGLVSGGGGCRNAGGGNTHVALVTGVNIGAVDVASSSATSVRKKSKLIEQEAKELKDSSSSPRRSVLEESDAECSRNSAGTPLVQILSMSEGERVTSIVPVSEFAEDQYLLMLTMNGCIKKVPLKLFSGIRSTGTIAIKLKKLGLGRAYQTKSLYANR